VNAFLLWVAQGFGVGRIAFAPGTFGSVVGLGWFALLLLTGNIGLFLAGTLAGLVLSVWVCGVGESVLKKKDPGSVVMDEIAAIPICFTGWIGILIWKTGSFPAPQIFFSRQHWLPTLGVFAAFRFFDVLKPWPVRQSQWLVGGWGVTIDDVLAAIYVNAGVLVVYFFRARLHP
jgi:phosphatidylglycerophosphatase A